MARGSLNWFEMHVEKIVLGLAAAFAIFLFVKFFILKPNTISYNNKPVVASELKQEILNDAQQLEAAMRNAKPQDEPIPDLASKLQNEFEKGILVADGKRPALPELLYPTQPYGLPAPQLDEEEERTDLQLVTPLAPEQPVVVTGRAEVIPDQPTLDPKPTQPGSNRATPEERAWVTVASWFPLNSQRAEFINAGYAPFRANPYFVSIDAQRQELLSSGEYSDWEEVALSNAMPRVDLPLPAVDPESGVMLNKSEIDDAYNLLRDTQQQVAQPKFYDISAGDPWNIPELPGLDLSQLLSATDLPTGGGGRNNDDEEGDEADDPKETNPLTGLTGPEKIRKAKELVKKVREQIESGNYADAYKLAGQILNANPTSSIEDEVTALRKIAEKSLIAEKMRGLTEILEHPNEPGKVAIWFNDDSVEGGKTYRYRLRVSLWNRYVGRAKNVADDADAEKLVINGEWSLPSKPIEVAPSTHFFVASRSVNDEEASIDVFKWDKGSWIKKRYDVGIGETIGRTEDVRGRSGSLDFSTGAIVIDIQERRDYPLREKRGGGEFEYRGNDSVIVTYFDQSDGRVKQMHYDRAHPLYKQLDDLAS